MTTTGRSDRPEVITCTLCGCHDVETFLESKGFAILRCANCGLRFLHPQPTSEDIAELYSKEYFVSMDSSLMGYSEYLGDASNHRKTFRSRLKHLPMPAGSRQLLDVGAATGFFVEQARIAGWDAQGIEPSHWASDYARTQLGQPVFRGTLSEANLPPASYDVITMWEVIEHLPDPRSVVKEAASLLRSNGLLALTTPDAGSLVARVTGKHWLGWRKVPEHLFFFDSSTLRRLLDECGFEVISQRYVSITVDAQFAWSRLMTLLRLPHSRLPSLIGARSLPVNPLYDLFVLARLRPAVGA